MSATPEPLLISSGELVASISPLGAELVELHDQRSQWNYIWEGKQEVWGRHAPVLFPFVGKLASNQYLVSGRTYPMGQHGFARDRQFEVMELYTDLARFMLESDDVSLAVYPYQFRLFITHQLVGRVLITTYEVVNTGESAMYFSIGAHLGFRLPEGGFDGLEIHFESEENLERHLLKDGLLNGETEGMGNGIKSLKLTPEMFAKDALVWKNLNSRSLDLVKRNTNWRIQMTFSDFPYFGVWTKPGNQEFICLEPWHGIADTVGFEGNLDQKEGIITLAPGESKSLSFSTGFGPM